MCTRNIKLKKASAVTRADWGDHFNYAKLETRNSKFDFGICTDSLHEHSKNHTENYLAYRHRAKQMSTIESSFINVKASEMDYWRQILNRIISAIKYLGSRGLAFRGKNETIGSKQ